MKVNAQVLDTKYSIVIKARLLVIIFLVFVFVVLILVSEILVMITLHAEQLSWLSYYDAGTKSNRSWNLKPHHQHSSKKLIFKKEMISSPLTPLMPS